MLLFDMNDPWAYIASLGVKHCQWNDPLFAEGNKKCNFLQKVPCVDLDDESVLHESYGTISCNIPGCRKSFSTVAEHAAHQKSSHSCMCTVCRSSFPTHHLLDLHILEAHDSFFQVSAERKPLQYQCLLETCKERFNNPVDRKEHCMKNHKFPSDFRYDLSWRKIGKKGKGCRQDQPQSKSPSMMECDEEMSIDTKESLEDTDKSQLKKNIAKSKTVPVSFSFGSGVPRGFHRGYRGKGQRGRGRSNHWHQVKRPPGKSNINIEEVNMKDLEEALVGDNAEMRN